MADKFANLVKKYGKHALAFLLAVAMVAGIGIYGRQSKALKADEEAPEAPVVEEVAEPAPAPAPEPEPAPAPAPAPEPAPAPVQEPVVVVEEIVIPSEEPAPASEPAAEEPPVAGDDVPDVPSETTGAPETKTASESVAPAPEEFDLLKAYEHYMNLGAAEREAYLASLAPADRAALEDYIRLMAPAEEPVPAAEPEIIIVEGPAEIETDAEPVDGETDAEPVDDETDGETGAEPADDETDAEPVDGETDGETDDEPVDDETDAEPVDDETDGETNAEPVDDETDGETDAEPAETEVEEILGDPEISYFSSQYISGEWNGRATSQVRTVSFTVYKDGALVSAGDLCHNNSKVNFSVVPGENAVIENVSSSSYTFSGAGGSYAVDMYAETYVTVTVSLASVQPAEPEPAAEPEEFDPAAAYEQLTALETEEEKEAFLAELTDEQRTALVEFAQALEAEADAEEFDVARAYEYIMSLPDEEQDEYFATLTEEQQAELVGFAQAVAEAEAVPEEEHYRIDVALSYEGKLAYGTVVTMTGTMVGYDGDAAEFDFVWEESADGGETWSVIEGATGLVYSFEVTEANATHLWRVSIA